MSPGARPSFPPARRRACGAAGAPRWFRLSSLLGAALALLLLVLTGGQARADGPEPLLTPPRDAPLILPSARVTVPPLPSNYQQRDLGWMTIAYPPSVYERVQPLIEDAPGFKAKLADLMGQPVLDHVEVRIARNTDEMATLAPANMPPYAYASGIAYRALHLVLLSLTEANAPEATDLLEVFRHELFHVALEDAVRGHHVPLWFNEGMAIHVSAEHWVLRLRSLWYATLARTLIPLSELDQSFPSRNYEVSIAYAESADFVRFLLRDQDRTRFTALIARVREGEPFERALDDSYDTNVRKLETEWREDCAKRFTYGPVFASGALVWVFALGALPVAYARKKRRDRAILERWEEEEKSHARREAPLPGEAEPTISADPASVRPGPPKVEHDGSWHTLH